MLAIKTIIEHLAEVGESITKRGLTVDLKYLVELYRDHKALSLDLEDKRALANRLAKELSRTSQDRSLLIKQGREVNHEISLLEVKLRELNLVYQEMLLQVPNLLPIDTPLGNSDKDNLIVKTYLTPPYFDFTPKDHVTLGLALDLLDFESGTKVAGSKFYFLKNEAVLLENALKMLALKIAISYGYTALITPDVAKKEILIGAGFNPRGNESNTYALEGLDLNLIATAEITVGGMHANEILTKEQLPLKYIAESHCFRREAGASGQENKGLYRVHQFSKMELFQIVAPENAEQALEEIITIEETIYQQLQLPYRVVRICAGDLGAAAFKKFDIEAWMPGRDSQEKYGEITSASNCTDFQTRRLNIRYRDKLSNRKIYPYSLNGTAVALSRVLMAIFENYQQKDGSIVIPEVLREYVGKDCITRS